MRLKQKSDRCEFACKSVSNTENVVLEMISIQSYKSWAIFKPLHSLELQKKLSLRSIDSERLNKNECLSFRVFIHLYSFLYFVNIL